MGLDDRFVVSYIGTVGMACGLDVILRAAEELKRAESTVSFLIVGNGARREELESMASERGLDNIVFAGRRPRSEIPAFLAISDVPSCT